VKEENYSNVNDRFFGNSNQTLAEFTVVGNNILNDNLDRTLANIIVVFFLNSERKFSQLSMIKF
jgi:hypothetical protein